MIGVQRTDRLTVQEHQGIRVRRSGQKQLLSRRRFGHPGAAPEPETHPFFTVGMGQGNRCPFRRFRRSAQPFGSGVLLPLQAPRPAVLGLIEKLQILIDAPARLDEHKNFLIILLT